MLRRQVNLKRVGSILAIVGGVGMTAWWLIKRYRTRSTEKNTNSVTTKKILSTSAPVALGEMSSCVCCGEFAVVTSVVAAGFAPQGSQGGRGGRISHSGSKGSETVAAAGDGGSGGGPGSNAGTISVGSILVTGTGQVYVRGKLVATEGQIVCVCAKCGGTSPPYPPTISPTISSSFSF